MAAGRFFQWRRPLPCYVPTRIPTRRAHAPTHLCALVDDRSARGSESSTAASKAHTRARQTTAPTRARTQTHTARGHVAGRRRERGPRRAFQAGDGREDRERRPGRPRRRGRATWRGDGPDHGWRAPRPAVSRLRLGALTGQLPRATRAMAVGFLYSVCRWARGSGLEQGPEGVPSVAWVGLPVVTRSARTQASCPVMRRTDLELACR